MTLSKKQVLEFTENVNFKELSIPVNSLTGHKAIKNLVEGVLNKMKTNDWPPQSGG